MGHEETGHAGCGKELITMRVRTAGWWPPVRLARLNGSSARGSPRFAVLAVVMVAAGMTAGSAPAASQPRTMSRVHTSASTTATGNDAIWTADPGGTFKASGSIQVADAKTGTVAKCSSLTLGGTLQGEVNSGAGVGSITSATLVGCTLGKTSVKVTVHGLPWSLNATGYKSGVVTGTISGIDLVAVGSGCSATLDGTAGGADNGLAALTYTNSAAKLTLGGSGNLHWWMVGSCSGAVDNGDPAQALGNATVTPKQILTQFCLPYRQGIKLNPHFPMPKPPKKATRTTLAQQPGCTYIAGFTNARKLGEAAFVGPAYNDLVIALVTYFYDVPEYLQDRNAGLPQYDGQPEFPPTRATLLGFGFMPVSATLQLSETGTFNAIFLQREHGKFGCKKPKGFCAVTTVTARLDLHLSDVNVNGVPLNVGSNCQTATPFTVTLKGQYPAYQITNGGPLTGTVNIPPFKGCHNGTDNLDPIFTASVSGAGNETLLTQARPCVPNLNAHKVPGCPPGKPHPNH
jgi:hypothetical protein